MEEDEFDQFNSELEVVRAAMRSADFPLGQVSGWDDDTEGIDEDRNPCSTPMREILCAAESGNLAKIATLISLNPELIQATDKDGYTPLHRACYSNHFLLKHGANIHAETEDGWQPLHSACKWNNAHCAANLLEHGADPNVTSLTPLHLAASNSHARDTLQLLLMHPDIKTDVKNGSNELPVDLAQRCGKYSSLFEITEPCINQM
ncbi:Ankyrin repeat domain-containing protein 49 [Blattella germanica]|nr:Ankyrin repeat domain-containing protein 49 [Blattella germanica]